MREQKGVSSLRFVSLFPHYRLKASKESEKKIKKKNEETKETKGKDIILGNHGFNKILNKSKKLKNKTFTGKFSKKF